MTRPSDEVVDTVRRVAARLESQGVPVAWVDGWEDRGRPWSFAPRGLVIHHTATHGYEYDYPSLGIVRDGRSDLPGPLAQFGLGRHTGTVYVIAAGYANHAGEGGWEGLSGNGSVWGVEAENDGIGEPWNPVALRSYVLLAVALCVEGGFGPDVVCCHREWSQWKIDPTGIDGDQFRADVAAGGFTEEDFLAALNEDEQRELLEGIRQVRSDATFLKDLAARLVAGSGDSPDYYGDAIRTHGLIEQAAARSGDGGAGGNATFTITGSGGLTFAPPNTNT